MKKVNSFLELAYAPISNHEFYYLKQEEVVKKILQESMLYIICQRQELTFENITYDNQSGYLKFEINKKGSSDKLVCSFSIYQENIEPQDGGVVAADFGSTDNKIDNKSFPLSNIKGIKFYRESEKGEFLLWITPDKFLHHYWNGLLDAKIDGDYRKFTEFMVHYIGESTEQDIWKRLTGHEKLQDILTIEKSFYSKSINTHEIVLLLFKIGSIEEVSVLNGPDDSDAFIDNLMGQCSISKKDVVLDVEKALINLLKPSRKYNKTQYCLYPKSKNGLYGKGYDYISYKINDNIMLECNGVKLLGDVDPFKSTAIIIENDKKVRIEQPSP